MKYKVGDKVRIVSEWGKGCYQDPKGKMDKWLGKVMTVNYVGEILYRMVEDSEYWGWTENCIAGLACEKKIVITTDGAETLARLYEGSKVVNTATAKCAPNDNFNFEMEAKIAFERLFDSEKHFNGVETMKNKFTELEKEKLLACVGYAMKNAECKKFRIENEIGKRTYVKDEATEILYEEAIQRDIFYTNLYNKVKECLEE